VPEDRNGSNAPVVLSFDDLTLKEHPVRIGKDHYVLREPDGEVVNRWRAHAMRSVRATGAPKDIAAGRGTIELTDSVSDTPAYVVSLCLYRSKDPNGYVLPVDREGWPHPMQRVPPATVKSWPSRVQDALFEKVKEMSGLGDNGHPAVEEDTALTQSTPATNEPGAAGGGEGRDSGAVVSSRKALEGQLGN
jgi:hypothetical protein